MVDILLKNRLYAARYFEMNDPMEGQYIVDPNGSIDEDIKRSLEGAKKALRICSLSRSKDIELMWAFLEFWRPGKFILSHVGKFYNLPY